jgi:replicative DNA helicase
MGVKVFALDYLQLMMEDPSSVKWVEIITRGLKQLAMKLNVMIILIVQFKYKDDMMRVFPKFTVKSNTPI